MSTSYNIGTDGDRMVLVEEKDGEIIVTIKHRTDNAKKIRLPPKRLVLFLSTYSFFV